MFNPAKQLYYIRFNDLCNDSKKLIGDADTLATCPLPGKRKKLGIRN